MNRHKAIFLLVTLLSSSFFINSMQQQSSESLTLADNETPPITNTQAFERHVHRTPVQLGTPQYHALRNQPVSNIHLAEEING